MQNKWWQHTPMRVIQTNLQMMDTAKMDPAQIAQDIEDMGGNVLVINVGGIVAWYQSEIPYHYVNPYLPTEYDLLAEILRHCHSRGIRVIARYDFSKVNDAVYQLRPQWFMRNPQGEPMVVGELRPGNWDLLYSTCINAGYRNEDVALKVLKESLERYNFDGVFFNAPHPGQCSCDNCRRKYMHTYGKTLPDSQGDYEKDWMSRTLKDCVDKWYQQVKQVSEDILFVLYYAIAHDNLFDRLATCDMICCEPQDVLSLGWKSIPQSWKPALAIRLGRSEPEIAPIPFGIIHSCPGMDWRHTGLPVAEYMYWMSQVPANGGMIWHSITGFNDTISDKRILDCVSTLNHQIREVEGVMFNAASTAQVALLWSMEGKGGLAAAFMGQVGNAAEGWAEALIDQQICFDVLLKEQVLAGRLSRYELIILPFGTVLDPLMTEALERFLQQGGSVLAEWVSPGAANEAFEMLGITTEIVQSENLIASYLRFEGGPDGNPIAAGFERTPIIAHRGFVQYVQRSGNAVSLATLVPPFAPLQAVGAPPERASILTPKTDLPLCILNKHAKGNVMMLPFMLSELITEYKLGEHSRLVGNMVRMLLDGQQNLLCTHVRGLQVMSYENMETQIIHLVNGVGQRPLDTTVPLTDIILDVIWSSNKPPQVKALLSKQPLSVTLKNGRAIINLKRLEVWEVIVLSAEKEV